MKVLFGHPLLFHGEKNVEEINWKQEKEGGEGRGANWRFWGWSHSTSVWTCIHTTGTPFPPSLICPSPPHYDSRGLRRRGGGRGEKGGQAWKEERGGISQEKKTALFSSSLRRLLLICHILVCRSGHPGAPWVDTIFRPLLPLFFH